MGSCANVLCKVILLKDAWTTLPRNPLPLLLGALGLFLVGPAFLAAGFHCGRCNECRRSERHGQKSFAMFHGSPPFLVERIRIVAQARALCYEVSSWEEVL
jgi:hypothetical protein